ncbi:MAG: class I SAM-dependent methyltransferase [Nitrospira sp.]|nr:class I SAM-dependent methyltransferase [Nitrospira sp.]
MGQTLSLDLPAEEEILNLLRYRLKDPLADVESEANDYFASRQLGNSLPTESQFATFQDNPAGFYASSHKFFLDLISTHLNIPHLLRRTCFLVGVARVTGARTYADWGAGAGRDCIAMSRSGLMVTHIDVVGEGTALAQWRYAQRGLRVNIGDAQNLTPEKYDIISNFDCMEHLKDPIGVLGQILSHLNPGGLLVLAVDFYNFDLNQPGPHLPKNFVYGGIIQLVLEAVGMQKVYGHANPWMETANAKMSMWQKTADLEVPENLITTRLRQETCKLFYTFRGFYDGEIVRMEEKLSEE